LRSLHLYFEGVKPISKESDDAILGFIYGWISSQTAAFIGSLGHPELSDEAVDIINEIFQNRLRDIKDKINRTKT
jgi:flagellar basal body-associated protein FliL